MTRTNRKRSVIKRPRRFYSDRLKYTIYVLWLHGYSYGKCAAYTSPFARESLSNTQIGSIIRRSPYHGRKLMSDEERQKHLDILKSNRLDRGAIEEWVFTAGEIQDGRQR